MKVSEITLDFVKDYLRLDDDTDDLLITAIIQASKQYIKGQTHLTEDELDTYADLPIACLALIADMYEVRQATSTRLNENPCVSFILNNHARGFI